MGKHVWIFCLCLALSTTATAQNYKKVIKDGKTTYEAADPNSTPQNQTELQKRVTATSTEDVVIYTKKDCQDCDRIGRILTQHQIRYQKKRIDLSTTYISELLELAGNSQTPTLIIKGKLMRDLSQEAIEQQLLRAGYPIKTVNNQPVKRKPPKPQSGAGGIPRTLG